jgi:transcriptional regulator with XRE-family HTH domain
MEVLFRKQLGFSQELYANYLKISKGLISLVEMGKRYLNGAASKKDSDIKIRWQEFEKKWVPMPAPPPNKEYVEKATKALEKRLRILKSKRTLLQVNQESKDNYIPDYQKANAFLQQEIDLATDLLDQKHLGIVMAVNDVKLTGKPLLKTINQDITNRLLDCEIAECEQALAKLKR